MNIVCLNDLVKCSRHFNADNMKVNISAMDHARKLTFSSYTGIYKQNVSLSLRLSDSVHCRRVLYLLPWELYLSFGTGK